MSAKYMFDHIPGNQMIRKIKKSISLLLLLIILLPVAIRVEHHHKYYQSGSKVPYNSSILVNNCPICNFEFSILFQGFENFHFTALDFPDSYKNRYNASYHSNHSSFSFLKRAPPARQS